MMIFFTTVLFLVIYVFFHAQLELVGQHLFKVWQFLKAPLHKASLALVFLYVYIFGTRFFYWMVPVVVIGSMFLVAYLILKLRDKVVK